MQVSSDGGTEVAWSPTGRELFCRHEDGLFAVPVRTTPAQRAGAPVRLFTGAYSRLLPGVPNYDVGADARRFLMIKLGPEESAPRTLRFVLNWLARLPR